MRILVIEDEPATTDFVAHGLAAEGYAVSAPPMAWSASTMRFARTSTR